MSGIYIPNVEFPKGCSNCYFILDNGLCSVLILADCRHKSVGDYKWEEEKRHPDCPIVPVPNHGRLIDAEALRHSHCVECTLYYENKCLGKECDWDCIYHIDHAETVIPAE